MNYSALKTSIVLPQSIVDRALVDVEDVNRVRDVPYAERFKGATDTENTGPQSVMHVAPDIKDDLNKLVGVECSRITYLINNPFFITTPHIDNLTKVRRISCLTWALAPSNVDDVAPTIFYSHKFPSKPMVVHKWGKEGFIFPTQVRHSMKNNSHRRILLQMAYDCQPHELKAKLDAIHSL